MNDTFIVHIKYTTYKFRWKLDYIQLNGEQRLFIKPVVHHGEYVIKS